MNNIKDLQQSGRQDVQRIGAKVTLRPDRADAYGLPRGEVYTVLSIEPHKHYKRVGIRIAEWDAPNNYVDSKELRRANG